LSAQLQLISSEIGVMFIRAFDISVYLEGNVIDLGSYKLQVVEACSGLRYLFPLMVFGFILAYFFQSALWKRVLIFLSTIPITILMNSIRIGIIGVTVEYWGEEMGEGFLHDFEGWVIFMACTLVLFGEMWLLSRLGRDRRPLKQIFGLDLPARLPPGTATSPRAMPKPLMLAILLIVTLSGIAAAIPHRTEIIPARESFASFPLHVGDWVGRNDRLEQIYIDTLKFSDYLLADFRSPEGGQVNLYIAYYGSQKSGESAHSPRSCLPGGGWNISNLTQVNLPGAAPDRQPLQVNRVVIKNGDRQQLVYYWFQQRGRAITNEYLVKWYLFWDSLTKNRTDGALIRLTIPVDKNRDIADADRAMQAFAASLSGTLGRYIPD
jgi:exosortase D (VPLPA-CTERM-specific)